MSLLLLTIRLSLPTYVAAEYLRFRRPDLWRHARIFWTFAAGLCVVHTVIAFEVFHAWSHQKAYAHTAAQTARLTGLAWGGGVFANYAFLTLWVADAAWWWAAPASYNGRPAIFTRVMSGLALFMFVNATVVFGSGIDRILGAAAAGAVAVTWYARAR